MPCEPNIRPSLQIRMASEEDLETLLPMVSRYHAFDAVAQTDTCRRASVEALLRDQALGLVWIMDMDGRAVGYLAVCFCYSIEFGGRDCFIDEFFVEAEHRNGGIGTAVLAHVLQELEHRSIRAVSLEVGRENPAAQRFYALHDFRPRERYLLMTRLLGDDGHE